MGKRKYILTWAVVVASIAMVFTDKLDGAGWITVATLALSIYHGANVIDKKMGGAG